MRRPSILLALAALLAAAPSALAHGGQYRGPGGRSPGDPTAPTKPVTSTTDWEAWWAANAWKYLNLRERLRQRDGDPGEASGGGLGAVSGGEGNQVDARLEDTHLLYQTEVLPVVTKALEDEDSEVRSAATVALGKMGFARSLLNLRRARKDTVRDVRDGALLAIGMIGEGLAAEELREVLFDPSEDERSRSFAAIGLGFIESPEAGPALLAFLEPQADAARVGGLRRTPYSLASVIVALGLGKHASAAEILRKDYASATRYDPPVRSFIAITLARLGDRESIPFLLQGLEHKREPMRQSAAIALGVLGTPADAKVVEALARKTLEDNDANTRQFAAMALADIGGEEATLALRKLLERGGPLDVPFAAIGLAALKDVPSLPVLRKRFADERSPDLKGAIALALGLYGDLESAESLRKMALAKVDYGLRGHCLTALGLMDDRASAEEVKALVEEENDPVIKMAGAVCLGLLRDPSTVPLLEDMAMNETNVLMRSTACRLLGAVGSPRSARVLIRILENRKERSLLRMTAVAGLGNLCDPRLVPLLSEVGMDSNYAVFVDPLREISMIM